MLDKNKKNEEIITIKSNKIVIETVIRKKLNSKIEGITLLSARLFIYLRIIIAALIKTVKPSLTIRTYAKIESRTISSNDPIKSVITHNIIFLLYITEVFFKEYIFIFLLNISMFVDLINKHLRELNHPEVEGIHYEQYRIVEKKGFHYIFENNKIIGSAQTLIKAKELINTIVSGC